MTTIPSIFNTGTGLSIVSASSQLPSQVDSLVVLGKLTVNGNSDLKGDVLAEQNLVVLQQTSTQSLTVNTNAELNSIGSSGTTQFRLPPSIGATGQVLAISDSTIQQTEWRNDTVINEFVSYDDTTSQLKNNDSGIETVIDNINIENIIVNDTSKIENLITQNIGSNIVNKFKLPSIIGNVNQVLAISDPITQQTEWRDDTVIDSYVSYDNTTDELKTNSSGVETVIDNINIQTTTISETATIKNTITEQLGSNINETFALPATTGTTGQVLAISDDTTTPIETHWRDDTVINSYVSYDTITNELKDETTQNTITQLDVLSSNMTNLNIGLLPNTNGLLSIERDDVISALARKQIMLFQNPNTTSNSIQLASLSNNLDLEININPSNENITISVSNPAINNINKINITGNSVDIESQSVLINSGGGYVRMPTNTPSPGDTIRIMNSAGNGNVSNPYISMYAP